MYKVFLNLLEGKQVHRDVGGRIFINTVPQRTEFPYIRISPGRSPEYSKDGQGSEIHDMDVAIYAKTHLECDQIAKNMEAAVDFQSHDYLGVYISNITMTDEVSVYERDWECHGIIQSYQIRVK